MAFAAGLAAELRKSLAQTGVQRDYPPRSLLGDAVSQRDLAADMATGVENHRPGKARDCVAITTAMYRLQFLGHWVERYAALATG